jgi:hypothetical protein
MLNLVEFGRARQAMRTLSNEWAIDATRAALALSALPAAFSLFDQQINTEWEFNTGRAGRASATLRREVKSKKFKLVLEKSPETTRV